MWVSQRYGTSLGLLTDLYQVTMAYGHWKGGLTAHQACFHLFFRSCPFDGGYTVTAGLADALDHLAHFRMDGTDLEYLAGLTSSQGRPRFDRAFLDHLGDLRLQVDVDAVPEGTVMFPNEPVLRVTGPLLQCQLLETPLLTLINFPTLIATKAARVCDAARWGSVLEFGLRRAQGPDGGITAARAAYVGGCSATSNLLAGKLFGIPVQGTHAHSWVMVFDGDRAAFRAWAETQPDNCTFLVDTYHTLEGVRAALEVGRELRERGHEMIGVRLDSGDLADLGLEARRMLDEAGFPDAVIVGSGDLDEHRIDDLVRRGAPIQVWGVGTRLTTGHPDASVNGVYKLAAIRPPSGDWEPRLKVSDSPSKTTIPGLLSVRRFRQDGVMTTDWIRDVRDDGPERPILIDPGDPEHRWQVPADAEHEDLLVPVVRAGEVVYGIPALRESRERTRAQVEALPDAVRRRRGPTTHPVGLDRDRFDHRNELIRAHADPTPT
jgi:nicotinate phosphoribosyltransferase